MSLPEVVEQYLRRHHVAAEEHSHQPTYTARQLAAAEQVTEDQVAKVVFLVCDETLVMAVLPADRHVNLHQVRQSLPAESARLATEREIARHIDSLELGAIPPFGSLFGLPVLMDQSLQGKVTIEVPAGQHTDSIRIRMKDFLREEAPQVLTLSKAPIRPDHKGKQQAADHF